MIFVPYKWHIVHCYTVCHFILPRKALHAVNISFEYGLKIKMLYRNMYLFIWTKIFVYIWSKSRERQPREKSIFRRKNHLNALILLKSKFRPMYLRYNYVLWKFQTIPLNIHRKNWKKPRFFADFLNFFHDQKFLWFFPKLNKFRSIM